MINLRTFDSLQTFLLQIPALEGVDGKEINEDGLWWVKFRIDIKHPLAWQVVQELGHVVNYLSLHEKLPTRFYPVSPPPYMNGGPEEFLSWVIENTSKDFTPNNLKTWLEGRLPQPVYDETEWLTDSEEDN
ncbi:hypothetical protein HMJ29_00665 [Hymenobacter taeanensis]|uniref:Uncharacterized protein n=1 Tax=Hymenobacter taeanensis TaxID=2735321 RepID=A0A6M6BCJ5_9BACT|nr:MULTISPECIES: hypothetical protein [Hymenobacter]QJX45528.1 hypothetical protein HMJ29_00665 [Hymenobacter taeanensis]UOQ81224.1 hypothetical protein MUN83_00015 [Hymenobacter sp. 5414T-23]